MQCNCRVKYWLQNGLRNISLGAHSLMCWATNIWFMYTVLYTVNCTVQCTLYNVPGTVYMVLVTVYSLQSTVYGLQCVVFSFQCTLCLQLDVSCHKDVVHENVQLRSFLLKSASSGRLKYKNKSNFLLFQI